MCKTALLKFRISSFKISAVKGTFDPRNMITDNVHSRNTLRIALVISFLLLIGAPDIRAQQSGLHGAVLDSTGAPIPGAEIEFHSGTATALGATDAQGKFSLTDVTGNGTLL